jgi:hypothetical protein
MRAALLQRQIKLNEQVLSGLHQEYANLRKTRKEYNEEADGYSEKALKLDQDEQFEAAEEAQQAANTFRAQAAVYTPYINKFKRKIAKLEEVQRALKTHLKHEQSIEEWMRKESYEWNFENLMNAPLQQFDGYVDGDGNVIWE